MDLLRHWRRRTFGAAAGALIAPVAIVAAALAVGIGGGGLGGLGSIGQALNGPKLPDVAHDRSRGPAKGAGRVLARLRRQNQLRARAGGPATLSGAQVAAAPSPGAGAPPTSRQNSQPTRSHTQTTTGRPVASNPPATSTPAPQAPAPAPTPTPSLVRQVGDSVKQVSDQVPVAGPPVGDVVDLLVDTVDGLGKPR